MTSEDLINRIALMRMHQIHFESIGLPDDPDKVDEWAKALRNKVEFEKEIDDVITRAQAYYKMLHDKK